jgi:hypothetical protein
MSISRSNFVKFLASRHRPPLMGQIEEILALLGGRSILRERVAKARKMLKFSLIAGHDCRLLLQAGKVALLGRAWGAYEAWGLRICNFSETREPSGKRGADRRANCHETVTESTLKSRARFRAYLNSPGFSDELGLF